MCLNIIKKRTNQNKEFYKEVQEKQEKELNDLKKQIRTAEAQKEYALTGQTNMALEIQNLKIEVIF